MMKREPVVQEKLARDKPGFDGFAETDVVRDQQIDARQPQGFAQGQQLVGIKPDAGPERGLQQIAVGRGGGLQRIARRYAARTSGLSGAPRPTWDQVSSWIIRVPISRAALVTVDLRLFFSRIQRASGQAARCCHCD